MMSFDVHSARTTFLAREAVTPKYLTTPFLIFSPAVNLNSLPSTATFPVDVILPPNRRLRLSTHCESALLPDLRVLKLRDVTWHPAAFIRTVFASARRGAKLVFEWSPIDRRPALKARSEGLTSLAYRTGCARSMEGRTAARACEAIFPYLSFYEKSMVSNLNLTDTGAARAAMNDSGPCGVKSDEAYRTNLLHSPTITHKVLITQ